MHRTRFILGCSAIVAVIALSGCDTQSGSEDSAAPATPASPAATATATASADSGSDPAANDAATAKACEDMKKDIKDNAGKIAKAEKIGPPAGHFAVSAQWAAGSTAIIAHSIGANETVGAAADNVQKEMMALGEAYNESADAKPSKKKLDAAIKDLDAACSSS